MHRRIRDTFVSDLLMSHSEFDLLLRQMIHFIRVGAHIMDARSHMR
jgi:hypothetical protein